MSRDRGPRRRRRPSKRLSPPARKVGLSPGTVVYTGSAPTDALRIDLIVYGEGGCEHLPDVTLEEALEGRDDGLVRWIDIVGAHEPETLLRIGRTLGLHALTVEDVANVVQRPKAERFADYLYVVARSLTARRVDGPVPALADDQISIVLRGNVVVTFQERPGGPLEPLRERLRQGRGRARSFGADYLVYAMIDVVVDGYFGVLEELSTALEALEGRAIEAVTPSALDDVFAFRRELLQVRRVIWPTRDLLAGLARADGDLFSAEVRTYLRDAQDHAVQVLETVEVLRESASHVHEIHLAGLSLRTNHAMRFLTVVATIFIPLTFVVGVYGMNFEHMPELTWRWGYFVVLGVMLLAALGMLIAFRRRRWI